VKSGTKSPSRRIPRDLLRLSAELEAIKRSRNPRQPVPAPLREHALYLLSSGVPPVQVAKLVGVTPEAVRLWRRQAEAAGKLPARGAASPDPTPAPLDVSPSPAVSPVVAAPAEVVLPAPAPSRQALVSGLSPVEVAAILELKKDHPSMGPAQIQAQLKRFKGWRLAIKAIARALTSHGYARVHVASRGQGDEVARRFEAPHRNALWQMDFAELRVGKEQAPVLLVVDDFSRFAVAAELMAEPTSEAVVEVLKATVRRHGKPSAIYTDRGGAFLAWRQTSSLKHFLEVELIDHHVTPPYKPQGRGKVEALVHTLRRELWELIEFATLEEAREGLRRFFAEYNHRRAHMGLDGLTPADRFFGRAEEVRARVEHACRRREAALLHQGGALPVSEEPGAPGVVEALRLLVVDGKLEVRFLGHRLVLGPLQV
jgi:transposase InsO family protein/transposase-like protein